MESCLAEAIPAIISVTFRADGTDNHCAAVVRDIADKVASGKRHEQQRQAMERGRDRMMREVARAQEAAREAEESALGGVPKVIDIYWPEDWQFYTAEVVSVDAATGRHFIRYLMDQETEESSSTWTTISLRSRNG